MELSKIIDHFEIVGFTKTLKNLKETTAKVLVFNKNIMLKLKTVKLRTFSLLEDLIVLGINALKVKWRR